MPDAVRRGIRCVLTDIDDTLSSDGKLTAEAYSALQRLHAAGRIVVPVTGRPAGWCDHIARMWPVNAVVGENGAFYMRYDAATRKLLRRFVATDAERIVAIFKRHGAEAKISSIHVNGWFGDYDKLTTTRAMMADLFDVDLDAKREAYAFSGDSPNDAPMFGFFTNSVGVANVRRFSGMLDASPKYVTEQESGAGFAEIAAHLLAAQ